MNFTTTQRGTVTVIALQGNLMGGPDATAINSTLHELVGKGNTPGSSSTSATCSS